MIGIFDSGIGGLTVVRELLKQSPEADFVYLGDTARTPYGNKSPETVIRYSLEDAKFLLSHGATIIVVACNTASALASSALRETFPDVPVFEVIAPAVEDALAKTKGRVGVIGTRATISSGIYEKRLREKKDVEIITAACPLLVPLVEEGWLDNAETKRIVKHYLSPLRQANIDTLILGCTHYPLLAKVIQRTVGRRVNLIDSGASVVSRVLEHESLDRGSCHPRENGDPENIQTIPIKSFREDSCFYGNDNKSGRQNFFLTDVSNRSSEIAAKWLGQPIKFQKADMG
ncbi:MAG: glutamate racemase [Patescibacteria group bacterium]